MAKYRRILFTLLKHENYFYCNFFLIINSIINYLKLYLKKIIINTIINKTELLLYFVGTILRNELNVI